MTQKTSIWFRAFLVGALLLLVLGVEADAAEGLYHGPSSCASGNCHGSPLPRDLYGVKQNEYLTWLRQDRHRKAYQVLFNAKSKKIARLLRLSSAPHQTPACLACHALSVPRAAQAIPLDMEEGISCEGCHGPSGGWIAGHAEEGWTHRQSVAAGMVDLQALPTRARTCLGCHLGDARREVDHELIAAGHPQLIFDLATYSLAMPAHWLPPVALDKQLREKTEGPRAWMVAQAVALRESMRNIQRRATSNRWPEFSDMDCTACHHVLKESGWRQEREDLLPPGLPLWNPARYTVLRHLIRVVAPNAPIDAQIATLAGYVARLNTPPEKVAAAAKDVAESIDRLIPEIAAIPITPAFAKKIVLAIIQDAPFFLQGDLHSAEQAVMGINTLLAYLQRQGAAPPQVTPLVEALYQDLQDSDRFDRQGLAKHLEELRALL